MRSNYPPAVERKEANEKEKVIQVETTRLNDHVYCKKRTAPSCHYGTRIFFHSDNNETNGIFFSPESVRLQAMNYFPFFFFLFSSDFNVKAGVSPQDFEFVVKQKLCRV